MTIPEPLYPDWHSLPYGVYLQAQRILRDHYKPEQGITLTAEIELAILFYGLTEQQIEDLPPDVFGHLEHHVLGFIAARPPAQDDLTEFVWEGRRYRIERDPATITVGHQRSIEQYKLQYPDELDHLLIHCALLVSPLDEDGNPEPFTPSRGHQWEMIREWPTPVCYSIHAFFLRNWLRCNLLTPASTLLTMLEEMTQGDGADSATASRQPTQA